MTQIAASRLSIRRVLVATDFSPLSGKALRQAISIARRYHSKFYIVHVVSSWGFSVAGYDAAVEGAKLAQADLEKLVSELIKSGPLKDIDHEIVVAIGDFWEELRRIATTYEVDLIVIGTHGRIGIEKMVMGSVAESVFRYARRPVLTVGPCVPDTESFTSTRHSILFPTDFSTASVTALPYAISIANEHGAELTLLHVVDKTGGESPLSGMNSSGELKERLRNLAPDGLESGKAVQVEVVFGEIVGTVVQFSRDQNSDLLVMGLKSPPTFFADRRPWLHASAIISDACCPVLTVRHGSG